ATIGVGAKLGALGAGIATIFVASPVATGEAPPRRGRRSASAGCGGGSANWIGGSGGTAVCAVASEGSSTIASLSSSGGALFPQFGGGGTFFLAAGEAT